MSYKNNKNILTKNLNSIMISNVKSYSVNYSGLNIKNKTFDQKVENLKLQLKGQENLQQGSSPMMDEAKTYQNLILNSKLVKSDSLTECGAINTLSSNVEPVSSSVTSKRSNIMSIRHYLNLLTKFDVGLANNSYEFFQFNRTSYANKSLFAMEKAANLIRLTFLSIGCFISKPKFNIVYTLNKLSVLSSSNNYLQAQHPLHKKIIIHLFYYVKTLPSHVTPSDLNGVTRAGSAPVRVATAAEHGTVIFAEATQRRVPHSYNINKNIISLFNDKFLFLNDKLTKLFGTEVEFELVRLYKPYHDSNILVQHLNSESYNNKFIRIVSRLFKSISIYKNNKSTVLNPIAESTGKVANTNNQKVSFPSGISGVNIKLAGRPIKERVIPRLTVKRAQRGNLNRLNAKVIEKSMFTDKSRKGAFNFTVTLSHIFK